MLGEHDDGEVLHWSGAVAGNLSVAEAARQMGRELTDADRSRIDTAVRRPAYAIIQGKGALRPELAKLGCNRAGS